MHYHSRPDGAAICPGSTPRNRTAHSWPGRHAVQSSRSEARLAYIYLFNLPYSFRQHNLQVFEFTATCFDLHKLSFRRAYEPWLFTICFCAFGIPDGLQFSYTYNVIVISYSCVFWGCAAVWGRSFFVVLVAPVVDIRLLTFPSFGSISRFIDSSMDSWMISHAFPHSCAACKWHVYNSRFSCSFFLCKNFISSFILSICTFRVVLWEAGDMFGVSYSWRLSNNLHNNVLYHLKTKIKITFHVFYCGCHCNNPTVSHNCLCLKPHKQPHLSLHFYQVRALCVIWAHNVLKSVTKQCNSVNTLGVITQIEHGCNQQHATLHKRPEHSRALYHLNTCDLDKACSP